MIGSYTDKLAIDRAAVEASRFFSFDDESARLADQAERDRRRESAHRLVKAAKCPTDRFPGSTGAYFNRKPAKRNPGTGEVETPEPVELEQPAPHFAGELKQPGTWAVVEKRDWAGEHRVRMETRPPAGTQTPDNAGDRITAMLTERGAKKISESCYFMACQRGGFSTFATLTLTQDAREKLRRRVWAPMYAQDSEGFCKYPGDPARAKQGPFGLQYQVHAETPAYNLAETGALAGRVILNDPDHGPVYYTPLKRAWAWSIQKEASRFFEAANKMYTRGWQYRTWYTRHPQRSAAYADSGTVPEYGAYTPISHTPQVHKIRGSRALYCAEAEGENRKENGQPYTPIKWLKRPAKDGARYRALKERHSGHLAYTPLKWWREPLSYLWVAEAPNMAEKCWKPEHARPVADEHGELLTNPHLHLMMAWRVPYEHFHAWARRLEKLWGHGFAHLEKIKDPQKAGSYVAKAAGYVSKAQGKTDQGEIRGNRYGISKRARAPGWIETERYQVGLMGWLLAELHEEWNRKHGAKIQEREKLKRDLEAANDGAQRKKIGRLLEGIRRKIEPLPRVSKYAALFKSEEQKRAFFTWMENRGWKAQAESRDSLLIQEWRVQQWTRRHRTRLKTPEEAWAQWFALADGGAVACNDEEREQLCG